jgi:hypothetical protein
VIGESDMLSVSLEAITTHDKKYTVAPAVPMQ